jgi:hypothetical protein
MQAPRNLFAGDQAKRLEDYVSKILGADKNYGEYAVGELKAYWAAMKKEEGNDPRDAFAAVAVRLLHRWIGDQIKSLVGTGGIVSPILVMFVMGAVIKLSGTYWKTIKDTRTLVR